MASFAAKFYSELPERRNRARWWLHKAKLAHSVEIVEAHRVIDRICNLRARAHRGGSARRLLEGLGLPVRCNESLTKQAEFLKEKQLVPLEGAVL